MNKQTIPFILIVCFALLHPLPAQSVDHLTNTIESLKIVTGMASDHSNDINDDGKTGLEEAIYELQVVSDNMIQPVAVPILRVTLPASWDENWFASPVVFDLDGDGNMEIIAGRHSVLYVWDSAGFLKWSAAVGENATPSIVHGTSRQYTSPVVGDLDNDR
jgi:hypothetical protein